MALLKLKDLSPKNQERIGRLKIEIGFYENSSHFWEGLSEKNKTLIRKTIDNKGHHPRNKKLPNATPLQMWTILHNEPEIVGVIEVAFHLDIIPPGVRDEYLQKIGYYASSREIEKQTESCKKDTPFWNHAKCNLNFRGKVVLTTQRRKKASNLQLILQEFQNEKWPDEIKIPPLSNGYGIADGVYDLNCKTNGIKFSVTNVDFIRWSVK